ncbi:hypothetical protein BHM03_00057570 [Ensete ventricosum]|nr:hypothetical protein BHM03_00057570 [Ensete ventricosum]
MGGVRRSRKHTSEAPRIEPYINIDAEESSSGLHSLGPWRLWGSADTPGRRPPFRFRRCGGRGGVVSDAEHCIKAGHWIPSHVKQGKLGIGVVARTSMAGRDGKLTQKGAAAFGLYVKVEKSSASFFHPTLKAESCLR